MKIETKTKNTLKALGFNDYQIQIICDGIIYNAEHPDTPIDVLLYMDKRYSGYQMWKICEILIREAERYNKQKKRIGISTIIDAIINKINKKGE